MVAGKASFDDVYDRADPGAYLHAMSALAYQIPAHARAVFAHLATTVGATGQGPSRVLDLCCSYGINAALLNHDVTLAELYDRYRDPALDARSASDRIAADRAFFADHRLPSVVPMVGLDAAANAVRYAVGVGLLEAGRSDDLERHEPGPPLRRLLSDVRLVTVTGGIGYITEVTFDRLLGAATQPPPWVAAFCLRWVDMAGIGQVLARHGLTLEMLPGRTFRQRRFAGTAERRHAFARLRELGVDPEGVETDGYHHTSLYVARPGSAAAHTSLGELLAPALPTGT